VVSRNNTTITFRKQSKLSAGTTSKMSKRRCGSRQIFGGEKKFVQICANLPEKNLKEMTSKKMTAFHWAQGTSCTIFAQISPKLPHISPNLREKN